MQHLMGLHSCLASPTNISLEEEVTDGINDDSKRFYSTGPGGK